MFINLFDLGSQGTSQTESKRERGEKWAVELVKQVIRRGISRRNFLSTVLEYTTIRTYAMLCTPAARQLHAQGRGIMSLT